LLGRGRVALQPADYPDLTVEQARAATTIPAPLGWAGWISRPSVSLMQRVYPERALRYGREGSVTAICQIQSDGSLACPVMESSAPDMGFEAAALQIILGLRAAPTLPGGGGSSGAWVKTLVVFKIA
jgi:TonB family protein